MHKLELIGLVGVGVLWWYLAVINDRLKNISRQVEEVGRYLAERS